MSSFPAPVPKPTTAGAPQTAIANTRQAYVNIRNGPGTQYRDIGDLRNFTLCAWFPASRTGEWVWVEQMGTGGWVSTTVITFEAIAAPPPISAQSATPYDRKVALWHWRGDSIAENTIEELARSIKSQAPNVNQVWVKTSDFTNTAGAQWMGYWDSKRNLAIDGPQSIDRWVQILGQFGLEFHAWCVPRGRDLVNETNLIIQACQRPGVKSMILDVEPYDGFWVGGREGIRPFMTRIRRAIPATFHIGLCVDPRSHHFETIFPREWAPFVNSVHPMVYWATMRREPDELLQETYSVWGGFGKPIIPALQGDAEAGSMEQAITLSVNRHGAPGLSWWRIGVMGPVEYRAIDKPIQPGVQPPPPSGDQTVYGEEQIVKPGDPTFSSFSYTGRNELSSFAGTWGWNVLYKSTEAQTSKTSVRWSPTLRESGKYEIQAFIPTRHATTKNARYKLHGVKGSSTEVTLSINQSLYRNQWVTLGVFDLEKDAINAGTVFLNDLTGESDAQIAFDAMRWRRVIRLGSGGTGPVPPGFADGYDAPIGTASERREAKIWPGRWYDASPFGRLYFVGTPSEAYHTGADLNLPGDGDAHSPVYSCASGIVVFAARLPTWGNVIIIKHDPLVGSGLVLYGRYAHVESMVVSVGQRVTRGQQIAKVGNAFGRWAYHLHFDLSPTTILETNPEHWPGRNRDQLFKNYIDPKEFIEGNRPRS
ncbi:M23 family metallopeptidase [Anaerolineae bacterium CFX9]|nr:peptidoglycan DD-metalloendopeptidase family protein [Kamptonema cortianum]MDL1901923.1 M23 family metallopeptidase [Anaerolineae bacterium CFX9]